MNLATAYMNFVSRIAGGLRRRARVHSPAIQALKNRALDSQCFFQLLLVEAHDYGVPYQRDRRSHDVQLLQLFQRLRVRHNVSILKPNPIFRKKLFR